MERYPQDLTVGIDDFRRSNWKSAIASSEREGYPGMWQLLSAAARSAIEGGRVSEVAENFASQVFKNDLYYNRKVGIGTLTSTSINNSF
jgi:hypothetical protein